MILNSYYSYLQYNSYHRFLLSFSHLIIIFLGQFVGNVAFLGGILAQEVLIGLSGNFSPIIQWVSLSMIISFSVFCYYYLIGFIVVFFHDDDGCCCYYYYYYYIA
jgi:NAD/NADP transhydrogenase beta subunit